MDRFEKALAFVDRDGRGLEIGPSHNPIAPRSRGFDVHVVDYLDTDALKARFRDEGLSTDLIEDVDFVWKGESLVDLVGKEAYDWVVASHVIEHLPDVVAFLQQCAGILRPGGVVSLIVPDKRYCFDHFRPVTTTGDLLDAHHDGRRRPSAGSVFEYHVNAVAWGDRIAWWSHDPGEFRVIHPFASAREMWEQASADEEYHDVHVWRFVPESFALLLADLQMLGLCPLEVVQLFPTTGPEFHVTLRRAPTDEPLVDPERDRRAELLALARALADDASGAPDPGGAAAAPEPPGTLMRVSHREASLIGAKRTAAAGLRRTGAPLLDAARARWRRRPTP